MCMCVRVHAGDRDEGRDTYIQAYTQSRTYPERENERLTKKK